jgi:hypothetical protein
MPTTPRKMNPTAKGPRLSEKEIDYIIRDNYVEEEDYDYIRERLRTLTFDRKYVSCFGEKQDNLFDQAEAKVQCWNKYRDTL